MPCSTDPTMTKTKGTTNALLAGADRRAVTATGQDAPVRTRCDPSGGRRIRPGAGVPLAGPRGGGETRPLWMGAVRAAVRRPHGAVASDPDGEAVLGVCRDRAVARDAGARARGDSAGRDRRAADPLGARMLRHPG